MAYPRLSISECTTYTASVAEDLAAYGRAGADGIGLWEFKLPPGSGQPDPGRAAAVGPHPHALRARGAIHRARPVLSRAAGSDVAAPGALRFHPAAGGL